MGLLVHIYRADHDSTLNVLHGKTQAVVVNLEGPLRPTENAPALKLVNRSAPVGGAILIPVVDDTYEGMVGPMFGGTFGYSSDSRFGNGALPIHDRYETPEQYRLLST